VREGWGHHKIDEFCLVTDYVANGSFASLKENVQYLDQLDFAMLIRYTDHANGWNGRHKYVSESAYKFLRKSSLKPGDLIMANVGDPGNAFLLPNLGMPTTLGPNSILIRAEKEITSNEFLHYFFLSLEGRQLIDEISAGAAQRKFNKTSFRGLTIPLPPLEEQQRIVGVLDEAFEGLACARKNAEVNLQNARELFESYAGSVFRPHDDPEESAYSTMVGAVCDIQSGAGFPLQYQGEKNGDFPFYKVSDMNLPGNEWELHSANHYVSDKVRLELRARIFPQDSIVFPKVGGAIATNKKRIIQVAGCVDNNVMGLIPDQAKVVPEYLHEWLRAFDIYEFSNKANPPSITQGTVFGWPLRVPSRDEQMQVVATAVELREHTETLRKSYEDRMQDLDDLRQSLLQKAFAGKLT